MKQSKVEEWQKKYPNVVVHGVELDAKSKKGKPLGKVQAIRIKAGYEEYLLVV